MGNPSVIGGLQTQRASNAERISMSWRHHWYTDSALAVTFVNITHKKLPQISRVMVRYVCCSCGLSKVLHRSLLCSAQYHVILVSDISRLNINDPKMFSPLMAVNGGQTETYRLNIIEYQYFFTWLQYIIRWLHMQVTWLQHVYSAISQCHYLHVYKFYSRYHKILLKNTQSLSHDDSGCVRHFNSLRAKFCRGNINIYLHFMSWLHIDMTQVLIIMMTSWNGNIFRVTGHLCGEFTGPRWIRHTKASDAELWCLLWSESQ